MGIVKISDALHDEIRHASTVMSRSINAQAEFWVRIGMLAELNPDLNYTQLCKMLLRNPAPNLETLVREKTATHE
ncbi:ParD-like family protein [Microbulbifer elongatus]|uniref:ParD-like family protein n=1 Tax=Microbulbifer elongatus TaxID=86173 RepID=A0ABT1NZ40_9GAMM|nr:ParD-like family protein [Microbulbifer elongatus]